MMLLVDLVTARCGSSDSPAASVAISLPMKEKTTSSTPVRIAPGPLGRKPPWSVRFDRPARSLSTPGRIPSTASAPITMNAPIATTLMPANQNSNSPYEPTETRFVAVSTSMTISAQPHCGTAGIQLSRMTAPAVASMARTTTQKNQYSQPIEKPAQRPSARSACAENEPEVGLAADISPSIRMTRTTMAPTRAYDSRMPGPAVAMPELEPTKRPAPITPPMAIIDRWRFLSPAWRPSPERGPPPGPSAAFERVGCEVMGENPLRRGTEPRPGSGRVGPVNPRPIIS